jgi:lipopolysaccharide transport system ATP-binding protein
MLAVGDRSFRKKCLEKISALKARGCTFLFVSHNQEDIRFLCERAIWIEKGQVQRAGPVDEILVAYNATMA